MNQKLIFCSWSLIAALTIFLGTACKSPNTAYDVGNTGFLAYEGNQTDWPTEESALVEREFLVPVYHGLPPQPYTVMGCIIGTQQNVIGRGLAEGLWSDRDRLRDVAAQAKLKGADAVMLTTHDRIMSALKIPAGEEGKQQRPLYNFPGAVVAIQWADQE